MKSIKIVFFIIWITITGCDTGVEEFKIDDELISVTGFISPQDTVLVVALFEVEYLNSGLVPKPIIDASVKISDGMNEQILTYKSALLAYTAKPKSLKIEENQEYYLQVTTDKSIVEAHCTIPPNPGAVTFEGDNINDNFEFSVSWDNPYNHNYVTYNTYAEGTYTSSDILPSTGTIGEPREWDFPFVGEMPILTIKDYIVPDSSQADKNKIEGWVTDMNHVEEAHLTFSLRNIDKNFYKYITTNEAFMQWEVNLASPLYTLLPQPRVHTNIEGGIGVFCGYNSRVTEYSIK